MTNRPSDSTTSLTVARTLVKRAARHGVDLPVTQARSIARSVGQVRAPRRVDDICAIVKAGQHAGITISSQAASQKLAKAGGDVRDAIYRLTSPMVRPNRPENLAERTLIDVAAELGVTVTSSSAEVTIAERGVQGAYAYVHDIARCLRAAANLGFPMTEKGVRVQLGTRTADEIVEHMEATITIRRERWARPCRVRVVPRARREASHAFATCGCQFCEARLQTQMIAATRAVISRFRLPFDEAEAVAPDALMRALDGWSAEGEFGSYYMCILEQRLRDVQRKFDVRRRHEVSLEQPGFREEDDDHQAVIDRVHDERSIDPARVVIWREQLREAIDAWRDSRAARADDYDRELVPA